MQNPIIAALDVPSLSEAVRLAEELAPVVGSFKIGSELFTACGPEIIRRVRSTGASIFLDLKFHDIPNTVAKAVASAVRLDVQMLTIHTSGGLTMMSTAQKQAVECAAVLGSQPPLILGVTVLTSMTGEDLKQVSSNPDVARQVDRLALLAVEAGLHGLVCSPLEIGALRKILPAEMKIVTPGIRTTTDEKGDQQRTLSPKQALEAGADWLVIGRPIYQAKDPRAAAEAILSSISSL